MGINNFFRAFQPKDKVFYGLLEEIIANLVEMAGEFKERLHDEKKLGKAFLDHMKRYEHQNDDLTHKMYMELSRNFITPFDREDIHTLATGLDDIADYINASTIYIVLYEAPRLSVYNEFAEIIYEVCLELQVAIRNLKGFHSNEKVKSSCIKVNSLENEADRLLTNSMVDLFKTDDAVKIIKASSVLENLEIVTDKAEMVANTLQGIIIKYS